MPLFQTWRITGKGYVFSAEYWGTGYKAEQ